MAPYGYALVRWADGVTLNREAKMVFDAVIIVAFRNIWSVRNKLVFGSEKPRKDEMFDDIRTVSYFWINNRRRLGKMSWDRWLISPHLAYCTV
ncbi:hypothetical protein LXL04_000821 [Taraxacum kok-saghyz]